MKKKWILPILLIICIITVVGLYRVSYGVGYKAGLHEGKYGEWLDVSEPPMPVVTIDGKNIPIFRGTYSWCKKPDSSGMTSCVNSDYSGPVDYFKQNNIKPVIVTPESHVQSTLDPKFNHGVAEFTLKNMTKNFQGDSYIVPKQKGTYIYEILIKWRVNQGSASYYFVVEVE